jgi:pimeloyl-ACP methyl ester carboxylesterase
MLRRGRTIFSIGVFAVAAALLAAVYSSYRGDIVKARERIASGSQIAETRCGPIEYIARGDGPAVLFVHGAGGGFDQGLDFIEPLVKSGLRVVLMSRFGYLRTPLPADASAAAQADAHACLLDALQIERAAVFGVSAGAPSSMQFALRHPQRTRALVLLVPAAYVPRRGAASLKTPPGTQLLFDNACNPRHASGGGHTGKRRRAGARRAADGAHPAGEPAPQGPLERRRGHFISSALRARAHLRAHAGDQRRG